MELLSKLFTIEGLAIVGTVTAISKLNEALIKVDGPATLLIRWLLKPFVRFSAALNQLKASVEAIDATSHARGEQLTQFKCRSKIFITKCPSTLAPA